MRIHADAKLEKCVSKEEGRPALQHILIAEGDRNNLSMECFGRAFVTDGRRLVTVPVTLEPGDIPGLITAESLTVCRKLTDPLERDEGTRMVLNVNNVVADNTATFPRKRDMRLEHKEGSVDVVTNESADMNEVFGAKFPSVDCMHSLIPPPEGAIAQVTLNPTLLREIAEALGSKDSVTLKFYKGGGPVRIEGRGMIADAVGVLMAIKDGDTSGFKLLGMPEVEASAAFAGTLQHCESVEITTGGKGVKISKDKSGKLKASAIKTKVGDVGGRNDCDQDSAEAV